MRPSPFFAPFALHAASTCKILFPFVATFPAADIMIPARTATTTKTAQEHHGAEVPQHQDGMTSLAGQGDVTLTAGTTETAQEAEAPQHRAYDAEATLVGSPTANDDCLKCYGRIAKVKLTLAALEQEAGKYAELASSNDKALQAELEKEARVTKELKARLAEADAKAEKLQEQLAGAQGAVAEKGKALQAELEKEARVTKELKARLAEADAKAEKLQEQLARTENCNLDVAQAATMRADDENDVTLGVFFAKFDLGRYAVVFEDAGYHLAKALDTLTLRQLEALTAGMLRPERKRLILLLCEHKHREL